jgi:cytochrome b pre-mRNA-processing protein 3
MSMILPMFRRRTAAATIAALYGVIVAQGRSPVFYADYGAPDTVEGRFDLLVLHLALLLRRLDAEPAVRPDLGPDLGQALFDHFCHDMDGGLRELGVGDLAVPRQMRDIAASFYGRLNAYAGALATGDEPALVGALSRNVFGVPDTAGAARLAVYVHAVAGALERQERGDFCRGVLSFPDPGHISPPATESTGTGTAR